MQNIHDNAVLACILQCDKLSLYHVAKANMVLNLPECLVKKLTGNNALG